MTSAMAFIKANESNRNDRLFLDGFAHQFVTDPAKDLFFEYQNEIPYFEELVVVRHKLFREEIDLTLSSHPDISQFISLGSGYCSLGHELSMGGLMTVFEVDSASTFENKKLIIAPHDKLNFISLDLESNYLQLESKLVSAGFDPNAKSIIIMEGLLYYFGSEKSTFSFLDQLFSIMGKNATLIFDMQVGSNSLTSSQRKLTKDTGQNDYFQELSKWTLQVEKNNMSVVKFGNLAFMDRWNRLNSFRGRLRSSIFVVVNADQTRT